MPNAIDDLMYDYLTMISNETNSYSELNKFINHVYPNLAPHMGLRHFILMKLIIEKYFDLVCAEQRSNALRFIHYKNEIESMDNILKYAEQGIKSAYMQITKINVYTRYCRTRLYNLMAKNNAIHMRHRKRCNELTTKLNNLSSYNSVKELMSNTYVDTALGIYDKLYKKKVKNIILLKLNLYLIV